MITTTGNPGVDQATAEIAVALRDANPGKRDQEYYDEAMRLRDATLSERERVWARSLAGDDTPEPWCNHDAAALDADGRCECGSTLSSRMTALLEDALSCDDSSAADIADMLTAEAMRSLGHDDGPLTCERCGTRVHNLSADGQCITCIAGAS